MECKFLIYTKLPIIRITFVGLGSIKLKYYNLF